MPILKNARHELFAQNLARGMTQRAAYYAAGYRASKQMAWRTAQQPEIVARVSELREKAARRFEVTMDGLIERAEAARLLAMNTEQPAAAVGAIKEMGVLTGLRVEKRDNTIRPVRQLTDDELTLIALSGTPPLIEDLVAEEDEEEEELLPN
ncbi:hypothetical protein IZ6_10810 [Terrihabitans soli]|uniref:Terminase small subunit n=2 Tax=Terrihabitans soli TaxID=708113 RepID=A0A6S6QLX6_9HYPH|nr:hypothetical protein IZ6_10810 [Terrihabitans soli]